MTYIVVTDNLIENLDNLEIDELKYEKIKSNEFSSNTNVSLFSDDLYKFVTDEFFTFNILEKINYDFSSKYIFQVKKSNLKPDRSMKLHKTMPSTRTESVEHHAPITDTKVQNIKLKPADADDVEKALLADPSKKAAPPENPMSADRVKWEHIHRVFELCNRNVSETARRLKMHRRTLQRILSKRSPK